jgi:hypothetical protein
MVWTSAYCRMRASDAVRTHLVKALNEVKGSRKKNRTSKGAVRAAAPSDRGERDARSGEADPTLGTSPSSARVPVVEHLTMPRLFIA